MDKLKRVTLKRVTFYLTQEQHAWLSKQALENKLSGKGADNASELIREAIELYRKAIKKERRFD